MHLQEMIKVKDSLQFKYLRVRDVIVISATYKLTLKRNSWNEKILMFLQDHGATEQYKDTKVQKIENKACSKYKDILNLNITKLNK